MLQSQPSANAHVSLTILEGPTQGQTIKIQSGATLTIGRSASLEVSLLDPRMSRKHFCVESIGQHWQVRDLSSLNGTFLNGAPIEQEKLKQGDIVMAGDTKFQITFPNGGHSEAGAAGFSRRTVDEKISNRTTSNYDELS